MYPIQQGNTSQALLFLLVLASDHVSPALGVDPSVWISQNGQAFATAQGAVSEVGEGWYAVAPDALDAQQLGPLLLHAEATGCDDQDAVFPVVAYDPLHVMAGIWSYPGRTLTVSSGNWSYCGPVSPEGCVHIKA